MTEDQQKLKTLIEATQVLADEVRAFRASAFAGDQSARQCLYELNVKLIEGYNAVLHLLHENHS